MSEPYAGMWDFDGSCAPPEDGSDNRRYRPETFSLGCFQWVRRGKDGAGRDLKRGRVQYRVKGRSDDPKPAYEAAREYCARKNASPTQQDRRGGVSEDFDHDRAKKWFTRLKKAMNAMPADCELLVSAYGVITLMPEGSIACNASAEDGLDSLSARRGVFEFTAKRVTGESSTI